MTEFRADLLNGIALAYSGDAVYEVFVRDYLLSQGITKPGELQRTAVKYVSAKAQAFLISEMEKDAILTEVVMRIVKRRPKTRMLSPTESRLASRQFLVLII